MPLMYCDITSIIFELHGFGTPIGTIAGSRALLPFLNVLRGGDTEEVRSNHKPFLLNDV